MVVIFLVILAFIAITIGLTVEGFKWALIAGVILIIISVLSGRRL